MRNLLNMVHNVAVLKYVKFKSFVIKLVMFDFHNIVIAFLILFPLILFRKRKISCR